MIEVPDEERWPGSQAPHEQTALEEDIVSGGLLGIASARDQIIGCQDEDREVEARGLYLAAGAAGHKSVPGADVDDWLDCDQCRDCFNPPFSHRPGGSAQNALALREYDEVSGEERAYRFGLIGASDTHDSRPGNGFKEFGRLENTEALYRHPLTQRFMASDETPAARSRSIRLEDVPLAGRRHMERGASFLMTGGLTAVHAPSRRRGDIWSAFEAREVYATSGDRILLWFDLLNGPEGVRPMGSAVAGQSAQPVFRVTAAGAFEQKPGCPDFVGEALGPDRLESICLGECYHPSDTRRTIDRLEIVRVRTRTKAREAMGTLIDDPWRKVDCVPSPEGCSAEFTDPDFAALSEGGREIVYYARAIQEPTLAVNTGGFRCVYDDAGRCVEMNPCYEDDRTSPHDDCLAENQEHAWSSPIFLRP